ncbi:MAG: 16S rRNA (cytidine(1402)-2'-O)-methyltransferase, partial [Ruminococcus sp.]|nr:16S rRNA (cytidine(1402)-2'-O)-methyltransferase [Ruminococcus sp.]
CISDPGELLVKRCAELGVEVKVVPGPTAAMSAIAISGLSTQNFSFRGFLSVNKKQRQAHLAAIRDCTDTLIFYEAPHKLEATLSDLLAFLGDRRVSLCRELTKIHEEVRRTTLSKAVEYYKTNKPKGEFVLVIEGARAEEYENTDSIDAALAQVAALAEKGMRPADACREIAKVSPFSKGELYTAYLEGKDDA